MESLLVGPEYSQMEVRRALCEWEVSFRAEAAAEDVVVAAGGSLAERERREQKRKGQVGVE